MKTILSCCTAAAMTFSAALVPVLAEHPNTDPYYLQIDLGDFSGSKYVSCGDCGKFHATIRSESGKILQGNVHFYSSDDSVFSISENGEWKANGIGTASLCTDIDLSPESRALVEAEYDPKKPHIAIDRHEDFVSVIADQFIFRLYNPNTGEHFYTTCSRERDYLSECGWNQEANQWMASDRSASPVYRLYNPNTGDHHYTQNESEKNALSALGWKDEGIAFYTEQSGDQPVFRLYNPNASAGSHHYTSSLQEKDYLSRSGWRDEGIAWYGLKLIEGKPHHSEGNR